MISLRKARQQADNIEDITKYNHQIAETQKELDKLTGKAEQGSRIFKSLWTTLGTLFVADRLIDYSKQLFNLVNETDRLDIALKNVHSSTQDYNQSVDFLNKLADSYGQNVNNLTKSYTNFIASSNSVNLSLQERGRIFGAVIKAGSALKLSNDDIEGSLRAITQMFSKGNIQAEELRGQLGERLPGAFDLTAKAMGVTTQQLNKMLENGEVLAADVLPLLATELEKTYSSKASSNLETFGGAWNRLTNKVIEFAKIANEATGFTKLVAGAVNTLADNLGGVVKVAATAVTGVVAYQVATKGAAAASATWALAEKAGLIVKGQAILALEGYTGMTIATTAAQTRATAAARTFNAALSANHPFGVVLLALTALYGAYALFKDKADEARKKQEEFNKGINDTTAPVIQQTVRFQQLSQTVLDGNIALDKRKEALERLKKEFPNLLGGIDNIGIAEKKLGAVLATVNGEYAKRIELAVLAYKADKTKEQIDNVTKAYATLQDLADKASKAPTVQGYGANGAALSYTTESEAERLQKKADAAKSTMEALMKQQDAYKSQSDNITKSLVGNYSKEVEAAEKAASGAGKANKQKEKAYNEYAERIKAIETTLGRDLTKKEEAKLKEIMKAQDKAREDMLKNFEKSQRAYLKAILNGNKDEEKASKDLRDAQRKSLDAQNEYFVKSQYLKSVAQAKSLSDLKKAEDQYNEDRLIAQMRASDTRIKFLQTEIKTLENIETIHGVDTSKRRTELYKHLEDAQKQYNTASSELAKLYASEREKELAEIEAREKLNSDIIKEAKIDGLDAELIARKNFGLSVSKLTDEQLKQLDIYLKEEQDKLKKQQQWREFTLEDAFATVNAIADAALRVFNESIDDQLSEANTETERALLENKKMWVNWGAQVGNVAQAWSKGLADGIVATVAWLGQGVANMFTASKRKAKAELEDLRVYYEGVISTWTDFMDDNQSDIEKYYGSLMNLEQAAVDYTKAISEYDPKFVIDNELLRAKTITETYNKAVDLEKNYYELQKKRVQEIYDEEIRRINQVFDIKNDSADLAVNAETMAVKEGMADQLLAMITNEESKASVTSEYAAKRKQIEDTFYLADEGRRDALQGDLDNLNGQLSGAQSDLAAINNELNDTAGITEERRAELLKTKGALEATIATLKSTIGSTQNEYEAVTESIKERDKALSNLLDWYVDELEAITTNEGQKRTEYTETEKVRKAGEEAIDKINMQATQDAIDRNKKKNEEILAAQLILNTSLEALALTHNQNILNLTLAKDEAIKASWEVVRAAVISGYDDIIAKAQEAFAQGVLTLEQYRALVQEANQLRGITGEGNLTTPTPTIDESLNTGFTPLNTETWSDKRVTAYLDWLKKHNLQDSIQARTNFLDDPTKYAHGTEYVDAENRFPAGVDTVPSMLTKGERVFKVAHNRKLAGMSNDEVVEKAVNFDSLYKTMELAKTVKSPIQLMREEGPLVIKESVKRDIEQAMYMRQLMTMNMQPVVDRLESLEDAIKRIPIQNFTIDADGITKFVRKGQSITEYHKKRYGR